METTAPSAQSGHVLEETKRALSISADDMDKLLDRVTDRIQTLSPHDDLHALVTDFRGFIQRGNIVDLAIGMIMGTSFTAILQSLVVDILSPILSLVSTRSLGNYYAVIKCPESHKDCSSEVWETPLMARDAGCITMNYGLFIENVVRFFINAVFLYFAVKRGALAASLVLFNANS
jgi:large-conductance mechanosensitive channel